MTFARDVRRRAATSLVVAAVLAVMALPQLAGTASGETFTNPTPIVFTYKNAPPGCPATDGCRGDQADPYPSPITVAGLGGTVTDVNVTLNGLTHVVPSEIDLMLQAPDGSTVMLMSDACGTNAAATANPIVTPITITFDAAAGTELPMDAACTSGTFRPVDDDDDTSEIPAFILTPDTFPVPGTCTPVPPVPCGANIPVSTTDLSTLIGKNPNGAWNLYALNDYPGDPPFERGRIAGGWTIDITTTEPPTTTTAPTTTTTGPTTSTTTGPTTSTTTGPTTSTTTGPTTTMGPTTTTTTGSTTTTTGPTTTTTTDPTTTTTELTTTTTGPTTTTTEPTTTTTTDATTTTTTMDPTTTTTTTTDPSTTTTTEPTTTTVPTTTTTPTAITTTTEPVGDRGTDTTLRPPEVRGLARTGTGLGGVTRVALALLALGLWALVVGSARGRARTR